MDGTSGSPTLRHSALHTGFVAAQPQREDFAEAIDRHIDEHFGPVMFVFHEMLSHLVPVHVYVSQPTAARPYHTMMTSGMSNLPMTVPAGRGLNPYAELVICLPPQWPLTQTALSTEATAWPLWLLKSLARLPHEYGTWVGEWHSVPNGEPAAPYAPGIPFAGVVVTPMLRVTAPARRIEVGEGLGIDLLALVPVYPAELDLKLSQGSQALLDAFDRAGVSEVFDPSRPSSV